MFGKKAIIYYIVWVFTETTFWIPKYGEMENKICLIMIPALIPPIKFAESLQSEFALI